MKNDSKAQSLFAVWVSLISNIFLTIIKIMIGFFFKSEVLIADGVHNGGDVIATLVALISTVIARKPADEIHPYGHGKAEIIGSAIVSVIMLVAALFIAYDSIESFFRTPVHASYIALIAAFVSVIWKLVLYVYCIKIGNQTSNKSLIATAKDHLADVYASVAAVLGIGLAMVGEKYDISFLSYCDSIAGIIVAFFVLKLSFEMGRESTDVLMEKMVSQERLNELTELVKSVPEVKRIDRIRARDHGYYIIVDVRVGIPGDFSVQEGHDVSRKIKQCIMQNNKDVVEVLVHLNPWYDNENETI